MRGITKYICPWVYSSICYGREAALCRLRIGHTWFSHSYLMSKDHQFFFDDCLVPQTVKHFLIECPGLLELRNKYFVKIIGSYSINDVVVVMPEKMFTNQSIKQIFLSSHNFLPCILSDSK